VACLVKGDRIQDGRSPDLLEGRVLEVEGTSGAVDCGSFRERPQETALQGEPCFGTVSPASWFSHTAQATVRAGRGRAWRPSKGAVEIRTVNCCCPLRTAVGARERQEVSGSEQVGVNSRRRDGRRRGRWAGSNEVVQPLSCEHSAGASRKRGVTHRRQLAVAQTAGSGHSWSCSAIHITAEIDRRHVARELR
jgi:hypothetical protein